MAAMILVGYPELNTVHCIKTAQASKQEYRICIGEWPGIDVGRRVRCAITAFKGRFDKTIKR